MVARRAEREGAVVGWMSHSLAHSHIAKICVPLTCKLNPLTELLAKR